MHVTRFLQCLSVLALLLALPSCTEHDPAGDRARRTARKEGDITIGVAWPFSGVKGFMREGVDMAVGEINEAGGVLGRKLRVIFKDDEGSVSKGRVVAQSFADDPEVVAVIGHCDSHVSIAASPIYEFSGLLMLSPASTNPRLTRQGFKRVFRNIVTDEAIGAELAHYAREKNYKRVIIYYVRNAYGKGLANVFERTASGLGIHIVDRLAYDGVSEREFGMTLTKWKDLDYDAIFLAASLPHGAKFIVEARKRNVTAPFLAGDGMDMTLLTEIAGEAAEGTVVGTTFSSDVPRPEVKALNEKFKKKHGALPDLDGATGYDALKVLAYAMEKAGSVVPDRVADALRSLEGWQGVTGIHRFDEHGDVVGKPVIFKVVRKRALVFLAERSSTKAAADQADK